MSGLLRFHTAYGEERGPDLRMRCPACLHIVTLEAIHRDQRIKGRQRESEDRAILVGFRVCPNESCRTVIYVASEDGKVVDAYPKERIDFDASNLPERVRAALEEAITCHANECYTAAGIMIRKTLEVFCDDREATGSNLKARIESLGNLVVLPTELLSGLDELRILGNDAAHVEARSYDQIGKEEIEVSLEFAKEVLKAVYQYTSLLGRLQALRKSHD